MTSVLSWQNSVSFCPVSFCTPRPNVSAILGISTSNFCIPVPYDENHLYMYIYIHIYIYVYLYIYI